MVSTPSAGTERNAREEIINLALGYQRSQVLFAALRMDLFNLLDRGEMDAISIAQALHAERNALRRFLRVLVDLELLECRGHLYRNTQLAERYLVKGKKAYLGSVVEHAANLWHFWDGLEHQVKNGCGKEPGQAYLDAFQERLKVYLAAMQGIATFKAKMVADALPLGDFEKMLDVGCGAGTYAIFFAESNPTLTATLIDLEPHLAFAREQISTSSARERIWAVSCQVLEDEIPGCGYDLVFISNLIHCYAEGEVREIVAKAWNTLAPGGTLAVHDYLLTEPGRGRLMASLFDLTMLVGTPRGRCYTPDEVCSLLMELGGGNIRQIPIDLGSSLVVGEKQEKGKDS